MQLCVPTIEEENLKNVKINVIQLLYLYIGKL